MTTTRMYSGGTSGRTRYTALVGFVAGAVLTGLILPFAIGDSPSDGSHVAAGDTSASALDGDRTGALDSDVASSVGSPESAARGAAAPGDSPGAADVGGGGEGGDGGDTDGGAGRTASDQGVTPSSIKLGIMLLDLATAEALGLSPPNYDEATQRRAYQAQIDAVNAGGGIHGRKLEAVYATADPVNPDEEIAACNRLTEDERVFIVGAFAGYSPQVMLCVAQQHKTPMVAFGMPAEEHFTKAEGRLVSDGMSSKRIMVNWVHELDRLGLLQGKKVGIVGDENAINGNKQAVEQGLLPALERYRYKATYRTRLSQDLQTGATQIPLEVRQMRAAGVDTVMLPTNFLYATQWVQNAESQGWRPQYHVSDLQGLTCDICVEDMPSSFDGAYAFTERHFIRGAREGMPEPEPDRLCRETYNRTTGENWRYGDRHPLYNTCVQIEMVRRTLLAAGVNPTRASWVAGVRTVGPFPVPTIYGGSLGAKNDYPDMLATIRWDAGCADSPHTSDVESGCYRTIDQPRRAPI